MTNQKIFKLLLGILLSLYVGCKDITDFDKYKRPDWLPGKLYTAVLVQSNLTLFAECLRLTGLDTILDVSGSWTVFAPTDEAIKQYLSDNHYAGVSTIPLDKLIKITKFHIIQNAWSLDQLQILSINGWRTANDVNKSSYAFKRQTMLKNPVGKYWIKKNVRDEMITLDSTISDGYKRVFVDSRKYVPIFYDKYFDVNGLTPEDYRFYFDRVYERGNVFYAGAKILRSNIFAENGFVHVVDRMVNPMLNAEELLEKAIPGETYNIFLELVYRYYPEFLPNLTATFNQPEVRLGGLVDTLWDLNYSALAFTLQNELTGYEESFVNETLVKHNGLFVPTDDAFRTFIDGTLTIKSGFPHWHDTRSLPMDILQFIVGQNFKSAPIYPSTQLYKDIFSNTTRYHQNEGDIIRKEFGSNCTFIGLNKYIPDRVFTSVTGPVFLRPAFSLFRQAMIYSGAYDQIAKYNGTLYFFPIPDYALNVDSSLILNWIDKDKNQYNFMELNRAMDQIVGLGGNTLRNRILNQVGTPVPGGSGNTELIRTLRGNYITWDHSNNTIRGTLPCTVGYNGIFVTTCTTFPLNEPADNGKAWGVDYWFNFKN
jgi:uncharacterized surface protein with fasciclin (FAS1) repeats